LTQDYKTDTEIGVDEAQRRADGIKGLGDEDTPAHRLGQPGRSFFFR